MKPGWTTVALGEICRPKQWKPLPAREFLNDGYPVYGANGPVGFYDKFTHEKPVIAVGCRGTIGAVHVTSEPAFITSNAMVLESLDENSVDLRYLANFLHYRGFEDVTTGSSQPQLTGRSIRTIQVPLPPLEEQRRIAAILDTAVSITALRAQQSALVNSLPSGLFHVGASEAVNQVRLGDVASFVRGVTFKPDDKVEAGEGAVAVMRTKNVQTTLDRSDEIHIPRALVKNPNKYLREKDILVSSANSWTLVGRACYVNHLSSPAVIGGFVTALRVDGDFSSEWLYAWFSSKAVQAILRSFSSQTTNIANLNLKRTLDLKVPVPQPDVLTEFTRATDYIAREAAVLASARRAAQDFFASLQARAFRGEL